VKAIILPPRNRRTRRRLKIIDVVPTNDTTEFSDSEVEILLEGLSLYEKANPLQPIDPEFRERLKGL
jgi:hypothetical protein